MDQRLTVKLTESQRLQLQQRLATQALKVRARRRLETLLRSDAGESDEAIVAAVGGSLSTVHRLRQKFVREGLEAALFERPRSGQPRKLDAKQEAVVVALACSPAPQGAARWSVRLLRNRLVELEVVEEISEDTVQRVLKKTRSSRGRNARGACRK
jgi:transposase